MTSPSNAPVDSARSASRRRYCLITPCRNEAKFIRRTLETTTAQTVPPARWVIVDDGSTDETPQIIAEYTRRFDYIKVITRKDRGARAVGPGVIETFYDGLASVNLDDYDYVVKFDGDLEMPPRYFERVIEHMEADPYLGNFSGKLFERKPDGSLFEERTGDENAVGPVKFYRTTCFKDIGGFVREVAWDGIDGHVCRMKGWIALSKDEPDLRIIHLRPMGSSQQNIWVGRQRWGRGKYFMGSRFYFVAAASVYRMFERPWLVGGVGIAYGYLKAAITRHPQYSNRDYLRHLRRYELLSLVLGKGRALDIYNKGIRKRAPHAKDEEIGGMTAPTLQTRSVLGVAITDLSMDDALGLLTSLIERRDGRARSVFYVNAHTLNLACDDPDFRAVLSRASYVFGDGTGVRWATRILHAAPPRDNVNGTDLTPKLFATTAGRGYRYYLLGNKPERIARAAEYTQREFPGWTLAGFHHGYVTPEDDAAVVEQINAATPHMLLVGMGNPLQERWIDRNLQRLQVPVCMGIGGLFDYWSGDLERAAPWVRAIGYEWLHLVVRQPHKARRYLIGNPKFLARVFIERAVSR